ncbi:MAG: DUF2207 domain-containing protein [Erysipelotrichaceae bacterium]|nr:DUF2207 domain-containing protein [Erysipelotrichaceae bacterium]
MKKTGLFLLLCVTLLSAMILPTSAQEAFTVDHLAITIDVEEDGTYLVKESYLLDFTQYRHGFYRNIPTKYEMEWTDEKGGSQTKNYYFPIDDISCGDSDTCDIDVDSDMVVIKIGDPDETVIGLQKYTISYRVHTRDLDYNDMQMLYWNLIGNGFDTTIKSMNYEIHMPKAFDSSKISAYTGSYGSAFQNLSVETKGNVIKGELLKPLYNYESATIMVPLEKDYFNFPLLPDYLLYALIASGVIAIVAVVLFYRFGKDDEVVVTVEFQAPEGLDSAGVGYVVDATVDRKDILSLIIDWANRGYIEIHEDDDKALKLKKIKDDDSDMKPYERTFFHAIFKNEDFVDEADLKKAHVGDALVQSCNKLSKYFHTKKNRIFTSSSIGLQAFMCVLMALPSVICVFASMYAKYGMIEPTLVPSIFCGIFALFFAAPWIFLMRKRFVLKKSLLFLLWGLCFFLNAVLFTIVAAVILLSQTALAWLYAILYIAIELLLMVILMFMDKRTKQGNRWLGQILGLREFILNCEKERLELLAAENPSAFYEILPYAYVLGVSDVWASRFESLIIPQPDWYVSSRSYGSSFSAWLWWGSFHHSFRNFSSAASYIEPKGSSGHGGGSIGGFGGGGFSGGGFGGGGGGSW